MKFQHKYFNRKPLIQKKVEKLNVVKQNSNVNELIKKLNTVENNMMKISIMDVFSRDTTFGSTLIYSGLKGDLPKTIT